MSTPEDALAAASQKLYLSPVMDLYNGKIVAYETSKCLLFGQATGLRRPSGTCWPTTAWCKACRARPIAWTMRPECFYLRRYNSIEQLRKDIDLFIHYYDHQRIRLKLKGLSPVQYRTHALAA